ncbi:MAG: hypothetical protein ACYDCD_14015 [Candidatus Acidiferrales bacterium]
MDFPPHAVPPRNCRGVQALCTRFKCERGFCLNRTKGARENSTKRVTSFTGDSQFFHNVKPHPPPRKTFDFSNFHSGSARFSHKENFRCGNISRARRKGEQHIQSVKRNFFYRKEVRNRGEKNKFKGSATECFTFISIGFVRYAHSPTKFQRFSNANPVRPDIDKKTAGMPVFAMHFVAGAESQTCHN